jgi:hypothetical protein
MAFSIDSEVVFEVLNDPARLLNNCSVVGLSISVLVPVIYTPNLKSFSFIALPLSHYRQVALQENNKSKNERAQIANYSHPNQHPNSVTIKSTVPQIEVHYHSHTNVVLLLPDGEALAQRVSLNKFTISLTQ